MATPTTLPATFVSGAVLTAAQQNDLRGAFRVLQVVTGTTAAQTSRSLTSYVDTTLTATITPTSTSSKILVFVNHPSCEKSSGNSSNAINMNLRRNGSDISTIIRYGGATATAMTLVFGIATSYMDSPASVAALTYKTVFANEVAASVVTVQQNSLASSIILMEISA